MASILVHFLIALVIICIIAALILWAVQKWFPEVYEPARYIVGGIALIAILVKALPLVSGVF